VVAGPIVVVAAVEEVPPSVEGYDDDVEGSRVKDRGGFWTRSAVALVSCICDSAARTIR